MAMTIRFMGWTAGGNGRCIGQWVATWQGSGRRDSATAASTRAISASNRACTEQSWGSGWAAGALAEDTAGSERAVHGERNAAEVARLRTAGWWEIVGAGNEYKACAGCHLMHSKSARERSSAPARML